MNTLPFEEYVLPYEYANFKSLNNYWCLAAMAIVDFFLDLKHKKLLNTIDSLTNTEWLLLLILFHHPIKVLNQTNKYLAFFSRDILQIVNHARTKRHLHNINFDSISDIRDPQWLKTHDLKNNTKKTINLLKLLIWREEPDRLIGNKEIYARLFNTELPPQAVFNGPNGIRTPVINTEDISHEIIYADPLIKTVAEIKSILDLPLIKEFKPTVFNWLFTEIVATDNPNFATLENLPSYLECSLMLQKNVGFRENLDVYNNLFNFNTNTPMINKQDQLNSTNSNSFATNQLTSSSAVASTSNVNIPKYGNIDKKEIINEVLNTTTITTLVENNDQIIGKLNELDSDLANLNNKLKGELSELHISMNKNTTNIKKLEKTKLDDTDIITLKSQLVAHDNKIKAMDDLIVNRLGVNDSVKIKELEMSVSYLKEAVLGSNNFIKELNNVLVKIKEQALRTGNKELSESLDALNTVEITNDLEDDINNSLDDDQSYINNSEVKQNNTNENYNKAYYYIDNKEYHYDTRNLEDITPQDDLDDDLDNNDNNYVNYHLETTNKRTSFIKTNDNPVNITTYAMPPSRLDMSKVTILESPPAQNSRNSSIFQNSQQSKVLFPTFDKYKKYVYESGLFSQESNKGKEENTMESNNLEAAGIPQSFEWGKEEQESINQNTNFPKLNEKILYGREAEKRLEQLIYHNSNNNDNGSDIKNLENDTQKDQSNKTLETKPNSKELDVKSNNNKTVPTRSASMKHLYDQNNESLNTAEKKNTDSFNNIEVKNKKLGSIEKLNNKKDKEEDLDDLDITSTSKMDNTPEVATNTKVVTNPVVVSSLEDLKQSILDEYETLSNSRSKLSGDGSSDLARALVKIDLGSPKDMQNFKQNLSTLYQTCNFETQNILLSAINVSALEKNVSKLTALRKSLKISSELEIKNLENDKLNKFIQVNCRPETVYVTQSQENLQKK